MTRTAKQSVGLFLLVAVLGFLTWRLWLDSASARRQQRNRELVRAVQLSDLAAATHLLDDGADPNAQTPPLDFSDRVGAYYLFVSQRMKPPVWTHMDEMDSHLSPLEIAAMHGDADMVRLLLSRGADAGYRDGERHTALDRAERLRNLPRNATYGRDRPRVFALLKAAEARKKARP